MGAVRRRQISQILNSALELAPNERASFLHEACKGDDALRGEVERLLANRTSADATELSNG